MHWEHIQGNTDYENKDKLQNEIKLYHRKYKTSSWYIVLGTLGEIIIVISQTEVDNHVGQQKTDTIHYCKEKTYVT